MNGPHQLKCLSARSPAGETVWEELGVNLLEEVRYFE